MKNKICIICGEKIIGYGHNSEPIKTGLCCNNCNSYKVLPEKIRRWEEKTK